jgi:hypothetical protein
VRTWKIIKLSELKRLKAIEAEYKKYEPEIERQKLRNVEVAKAVHETLERRSKPAESESETIWRAWNKK